MTDSMISTLQGLPGSGVDGNWIIDQWAAGDPATGTNTTQSQAVTEIYLAATQWKTSTSYSSGYHYGSFYSAMLTNTW